MKKSLICFISGLLIVFGLTPIQASSPDQIGEESKVSSNMSPGTQTSNIDSNQLNLLSFSFDILKIMTDEQINNLMNTSPEQLLATAAVNLATYNALTQNRRISTANTLPIRSDAQTLLLYLTNIYSLRKGPSANDTPENDGQDLGNKWFSTYVAFGCSRQAAQYWANIINNDNHSYLYDPQFAPNNDGYAVGYRNAVNQATHNLFNW